MSKSYMVSTAAVAMTLDLCTFNSGDVPFEGLLKCCSKNVGFLKSLFSPSQNNRNSLTCRVTHFTLLEQIGILSFIDVPHFNIKTYHLYFWTLILGQYLSKYGLNRTKSLWDLYTKSFSSCPLTLPQYLSVHDTFMVNDYPMTLGTSFLSNLTLSTSGVHNPDKDVLQNLTDYLDDYFTLTTQFLSSVPKEDIKQRIADLSSFPISEKTVSDFFEKDLQAEFPSSLVYEKLNEDQFYSLRSRLLMCRTFYGMKISQDPHRTQRIPRVWNEDTIENFEEFLTTVQTE